MPNARRSTWTALVTLVVAGITFAGAAVGADGTPVRAAAAPPESEVADETTTDGPSSPTTVKPTTSTTAAPTTTTAAPTTTVAPATTAPPPTAAPPPPPPPPTTAPPAPAATSGPAPATPQHGVRNTGCEQYMYDRINGARAAAGRGGLAFDGGIQYIAVAWSDHLGGTQVLAHNPAYADQIVVHRDYRKAGENVGRGYDLGQLFQAFMDSPAHRENIVSSGYSHVTVGCITDGAGQLWVTQNFWGS